MFRRVRPIARKISIGVVAFTSVAAGVAMVWLLVRPEVASGLGTGVLLATMALLFLPGMAFAAWEWDRRQALDAAMRPPAVEHRQAGGRQVGGGIRHAKSAPPETSRTVGGRH